MQKSLLNRKLEVHHYYSFYTNLITFYTGIMLCDKMLNLMAIRYGASSGHMTLESFISLILRLEVMHSKCNRVVFIMFTGTKVNVGVADRLSQLKADTLTFFLLLNRHLQAAVGWG